MPTPRSKAKNKRVGAKIKKLKKEGKSQKAAVGQALGMERQSRK